MDDTMNTYLHIDGSNIAHRYYHGMPVLTSHSGVETHALAGWVTLLSNVVGRLELPANTKVIVFWDKAAKTPKTTADGVPLDPGGEELWLDYKGNRVSHKQGLYDQISLAMAITKLLGFAYVAEAGVEADSLLGAFVLTHPDDVHWILSSDKDMLQLVNNSVTVVTINGADVKRYNPAAVVKKWGVTPEQIADLLVLMGDKSDNLPGVPEIGKVTAQELLGRFGSLDNVLENLHQLKPKQRQTLQESTSKIAVLRNLIEFRPSFVRVREFPPEFKAAKDLLNSLQMTAAVARVAAIQLAEMKRSDENIPT